MLANFSQLDQLAHQMHNRLQTAGMGLGLVRLLRDAGRTEEARTTLFSLRTGFRDVDEAAAKPSRTHCHVNRLKSASGSSTAATARR